MHSHRSRQAFFQLSQLCESESASFELASTHNISMPSLHDCIDDSVHLTCGSSGTQIPLLRSSALARKLPEEEAGAVLLRVVGLVMRVQCPIAWPHSAVKWCKRKTGPVPRAQMPCQTETGRPLKTSESVPYHTQFLALCVKVRL